ncbi:protein-S-isoprenylcysteine O-methyltransferase [Tateyamaria sp. ANG-S1]|uniref:protein-S-isoprenylcysteine O-methyltransferase n=1 Tax=Tateyamaria sp. ANG-S1 TaxID=1577905 RepID=UPI000690B628|nr:protein-S-isoprenylcysteine O-methyltransferase [Tateyamaria sp. ANG-S1]
MIGKFIPYAILAVVMALALWRGAPYASLPFLAFMTSWYTIRIWLTDSTPLDVSEERDATRERPLAAAVGVGMIILPLFALATPMLDFAAYSATSAQFVLGGVCALAGLFVFFRSHADLGSFWSAHLELREGHALVTTGIYSRMRHPMYTAIFLITIAQALLLANWVAGPAGLVIFALLYVVRVGPEERMMAERFGAEWEGYASRTPRLLPRLRD